VGNFKEAVRELKKRKIFDVLTGRIKEGVPFFGICLGMQLLLEKSEEAPGIKGLGVVKGRVRKFDEKKMIVPHMGWNEVSFKASSLFKGIPDRSYFYFAHSYYCEISDKGAISTTTQYGINFSSACHKDNIWGVQFHPEKSQKLGLKLFNNFLTLC
jgi:glutamine amidotransferase